LLCEPLEERWMLSLDPLGLAGTTALAGDPDVIAVASATGSISGTVFNDANADGIRQGGDLGQNGWRVFLDDNQNGVLDTNVVTRTTTVLNTPVPENSTIVSNLGVSGLGGTIQDLNVKLNVYNTYDSAISVYLISPAGTRVRLFEGVGGAGRGFINTILDDSAAASISTGSAPFSGSWQPQNVLSAFNGESANGDWKLQVTSSMLGAGTGTLYDWSLTFSSAEVSAATDASGSYRLSGLSAGTYYVAEEAQPGWTQTTPVTPRYHTVVLADGAAASGYDFGNYNGGWGVVWNDLDGNGIKDSGELPLTQTMYLDVGNDGIVDRSLPSTGGMYNFGTVPVGTHKVFTTTPTGWAQSAPASPGYYLVTTTQAGQAVTGRNFGFYQYGSIAGQKFNDLDGDGTRDTGEPGLAGWTMQLDLGNNGTVDRTAVTDVNGNYVFDSVAPGNHKVTEAAQSGWVLTTPAAPGSRVVTVTSGTAIVGQDFGNFQLVTVSGLAFNDLNGNGVQEGGESGLAGWTITLDESSNGTVERSVTTGADGAYAFTGVGPGSYLVAEVVQSGWTKTLPTAAGYTVTTHSGQAAAGNAFGNVPQYGSIAGLKFNDLDGDGTRDAGEPGLAGWTMQLDLGNNGTVDRTTLTDVDGNYIFDAVLPGTHKVTEVTQSGWVLTTPDVPGSWVVAVPNGGAVVDRNFGNFQLVTVSGLAFSDLNGDGVQQSGESGLAGWTITLDLDNNGSVDRATTTGTDGSYAFAAVGPGTHLVAEVVQSGWAKTLPTAAGYTVTTHSGQAAAGNVFGNVPQYGSIAGLKFNDLDGDGTRDAGEPGLAGWTMQLDLGNNGTVDRTTLTDVDGNYIFDAVLPGTHKVTEVTQSGWVLTTPDVPGSWVVAVPNGGAVVDRNFGNFQLVTVSGLAFSDLNGDGVQQTGESTLSGWTITLDEDANGSVDRTTTTDTDGEYSFAGIGPGTYLVAEVVQAGWTKTLPTTAGYTVAPRSGQAADGNLFGNFQLVTLSGQAFNDLDGSGTKGPGESGLPGWTVQLDLNNDGSIDRTLTTGADGNYAFADVPPGQHKITEVAQAGWTQTMPASLAYLVTAYSGTNVGGEDFGNHQLTPTQIISTPQTVIPRTAGATLSFPINYSTNTGDNTLSGLGVRIHFNSAVLTYTGLSGVLATNLSQQQLALPEAAPADDGDPATNSYVLISWADYANGSWPNAALPVQLFTANFLVVAGATAGTSTPVNFTAAATAPDYGFSSPSITVQVVESEKRLDADGNGTADALSDGITILRYLFDQKGNWPPAVGPGATRTTLTAVQSFLDGGRMTALDVDGNGTPDALTDGILILRYLFAPSGSWNFADAIGVGATRTTRAQIKAFLDLYNPAVAPGVTEGLGSFESTALIGDSAAPLADAAMPGAGFVAEEPLAVQDAVVIAPPASEEQSQALAGLATVAADTTQALAPLATEAQAAATEVAVAVFAPESVPQRFDVAELGLGVVLQIGAGDDGESFDEFFAALGKGLEDDVFFPLDP
jgi:subtilisin-like proprotein convertase family protein/protocatechuate 3,4-dioxygenase beta subunit